MSTLENAQICIKIAEKGAELQSIFHKPTNTERLWSGDPEFWAKKSPVLFPIVGALKNDTYIYEGKKYQLPRHGFARDMVFKTTQLKDGSISFNLFHDAETLQFFPFEFELRIIYKLENSTMVCSYEVYNPAADKLLVFSIGGHPAFAVDTASRKEYSGYYLVFNNDQTLEAFKITNNLISKAIKSIPLPNSKLTLNHELFYDDALVFKGLKTDCISLRNKYNSHGLDIHFKGHPFFGIWSAKNADFICLEPWNGIADGVEHDQNFSTKEGIIHLSPLQTFRNEWSLDIY